jgi:signal peptidase II
MNSKYLLASWVCGAILVLDQLTKWWVHKTMALHQSIEILPNFARLTYIRNTGAAFGFFAGVQSNWRMVFFILVSLIAIAAILYLLKTIPPKRSGQIVSLSLVLGGATGNLIDRLRWGEVIDFIDLHWHRYHWPAFNIADSAITMGVIGLLILMSRKGSMANPESETRNPHRSL